MGDTGRQKPDRAELVRLDQPPLEFGPVGNVIKDDKASDFLQFFGDKWGDRNVQRGFPRSGVMAISIPVSI